MVLIQSTTGLSIATLAASEDHHYPWRQGADPCGRVTARAITSGLRDQLKLQTESGYQVREVVTLRRPFSVCFLLWAKCQMVMFPGSLTSASPSTMHVRNHQSRRSPDLVIRTGVVGVTPKLECSLSNSVYLHTINIKQPFPDSVLEQMALLQSEVPSRSTM